MVSEYKAVLFNIQKGKIKKIYFHDQKGQTFFDQILQNVAVFNFHIQFFQL